jgi:hypothetical protein
MIHYIDDFLPQDQFEALANRVQGRFGTGNTSVLVEDSDEPVRITCHDHSGNWEESCNFIGQECRPAIEKMITVMEDLGIKNLKNWSIWFQYIINTMTLPAHQDQGLRKSDQTNTYTAVIYTSDWQPGMGGEFIVGEPIYEELEANVSMAMPGASGLKNLTHVIDPIPNRMLIWSREEWHAVQKVTCDSPNYVRSFFGAGWSSIDVQPAKGEFYDI